MKKIDKILEWNAARTEERFRLFREGKQLYVDFIESNKGYGSVSQIPKDISRNASSLKLAEEKFLESIRLAKECSAFTDAATGYFQLSFLYFVQGRYDEEIKVLNYTIDIFNNVPNLEKKFQQTQRDCYYNIGIAYICMNDMALAKKNLNTALSMHKEVHDYEGIKLVNEAFTHVK